MKPTPSSKRTLIVGAAWTVGTRWSIKGLGFVNTVIMARLLVPADYGIIAMAMLVVGLIQALMDFGATTALLRKDKVSRDEVDSVWTLRLLQSVAVGLVLLVVSPFAAMYFKEPRVEYVLWVLAACVAFSGAGNIGFALAQKEFNFYIEFKLNIICKVLGIVATVVAGYMLGDYRALVIGVATGYISGCLVSYWLHPYRARWNTSKIVEIWHVTKWLMLAGVGGFILRRGDELLAARIGTTQDYGMYNVGAELGQLPTGEVGPAMLRAFLPVLAVMRGSIQEVNNAVLKTLAAANTIILPIGLGFAAVAVPATHLILGPNWSDVVQYVAAFAIVSTLQMVFSPLNTLLLTRGQTKVQSQAVWLEFVIFLLGAAVLVPSFSLIGLVWARIVGTLANQAITLWATRRYCDMSYLSVARVMARPLLGSLLMVPLVQGLMAMVQSEALQLAFGISCGAVFYILWTFGTWVLAGRPDGLESSIQDYLQQWWRRRSLPGSQ